MTQNFTYLMFLCTISMLLIIGGVLLTKLHIYIQIFMILIGLIGGIFCFVSLIRILVKQNNSEIQRTNKK